MKINRIRINNLWINTMLMLLRKLAIEAVVQQIVVEMKESYFAGINKGIKLAKYVEVKSNIDSKLNWDFAGIWRIEDGI